MIHRDPIKEVSINLFEIEGRVDDRRCALLRREQKTTLSGPTNSRTTKMPLYLNETQAGRTGSTLGFPHLLSCLGLVIQTDTYLYGYHMDGGDPVEHAKAFDNYIHESNRGPLDSVRAYGCCNWNDRYRRSANKEQAWINEMTRILGVLGYRGKVEGFDASIVAPTRGVYLKYRPNFLSGKSAIFYKKDDDMNDPLHNISNDQTNIRQYVQKRGQDKYTENDTVNFTPSVQLPADLKEVDHTVRLFKFKM
jgi:hypothetical protein